MVKEDIYYLGFSVFPGIGPKRFDQLLSFFGDAKSAWEGSAKDVETILGSALTHQFTTFRTAFEAKAYAKVLEDKNIVFLSVKNSDYPVLLRQIPHPPFVVYVKGDLSVLSHDEAIGVVGTRKVTDYGRQVTEDITKGLIAEGFVIVSGLALGVDGIAHKTAIENNGKTIAVLGSSVDYCTPREHQQLYETILQGHGCVVSQFALNEHVGKGNFPARNRIIAGLSQAVLVTEGAEDSGALYTAEDAKGLGRPVFAIPGPITSSLSKGTNNLIKQGAIPISDAQEILDTLGIMGNQVKTHNVKVKKTQGETKEEQDILDLLEIQPLHFDEIARKIGKDSKEIGSLLSFLELKGIVKSNSQGEYSLT